MSNQYIGELRLVAFNFPPKGWALCNGQVLAINQNQALFSLFGTIYGGNGIQTFALPNLQGRTPISQGNGFVIGQMGGEQAHTLTAGEVPSHTHQANAIKDAASPSPDGNEPKGNFLAKTSGALGIYANITSSPVYLNPASVTVAGGSQPHDNMQPYLVMNWIVALQGIFPSRN
jgi:microcystin-dependent protein